MQMRGQSTLVAPVYTGVSLLLSWIYLVFYAASAGIEASAPVSLMSSSYMASAVVMATTVLVIAFAPIDRLSFLTANATKVVTPLGLSGSTALLIGGGISQSLVLLIAGGVLTGVFSGIMAQQWVLAYRRVSLKSSICSFPALMVMAVGICMTVMYLPRWVLYMVAVVLPVVSEFMFHWVRLELFPIVAVEGGPKDKPLNFLLLLLPIALCYLASGFLDYFSDESYYTFAFYAFCAFIPFVLASCFAFVVERRSVAHSVFIPVAFLVVMMVPIFSLHNYLPTAQFISIGELGLEVVIFIVAVAFSEFFSLSSPKVYALVRTCATVFNTVGWYIAKFVEDSYSQIASVQASLLVVFIGIEVLAVALIVAIVKAQKGMVAQGDDDEDDEGEEGDEGGKRGDAGVAADAAAAGAGRGGNAAIAVGSAAGTGRLRDAAAFVGADAALQADSDATALSAATGSEALAGLQGAGVAAAVPAMDGAAVARDNMAAVAPELDAAQAQQLLFERCCKEVARDFELSNREIDVLALLARGYSAARIQKELYIAAGTVNYHTRNIYGKLGVHSKQEVIDLMTSRMRGQGM